MKIYKKYVDEEKCLLTTFDKEKSNLAKYFIDVELVKDGLKEGMTFRTPWAFYSIKEIK